jgi:hypothetical protein
VEIQRRFAFYRRFEDDSTVPSFRQGISKHEVALSFISLARLSDLMGNILKLETSSIRNSSSPTPTPMASPLISGDEILEVNRQDNPLRNGAMITRMDWH